MIINLRILLIFVGLSRIAHGAEKKAPKQKAEAPSADAAAVVPYGAHKDTLAIHLFLSTNMG